MSTVKKFNYIIQFMKAKNVASISDNNFVGINNKVPLKIITTSIILEETAKTVPEGTLVEQKLSFSYSHSTNILNKMINGGNIFRLVRDNGKVIFFGSTDRPAYFDKSSSDLAKGKFTFIRQATQLEFTEDVSDQFLL